MQGFSLASEEGTFQRDSQDCNCRGFTGALSKRFSSPLQAGALSVGQEGGPHVVWIPERVSAGAILLICCGNDEDSKSEVQVNSS